MRIIFLYLFSTVIAFGQAVPEKWLTYYEQSGFKKTSRYKETMEYCRRLEKASPWIKVTSFGRSPEGRDLPLVVVSSDKAFDPAKASKTDKAVILIQNGIHSGEIEGKDACLMLMRDIAITKTKASLLDHAILLIIPIYNVDGHERFGPYNRINQNGPEEMGWRVTAQNLNLNRDYVKADAPETQAWLKLFNRWLPDFFVDCHVTDGADYQYVVTFGIETTPNVAQPVRNWVKQNFLPTISALRTNGNVPIGQLIFLRDDLDPLKGLFGFSGTGPPRFSTVYTSLQNRPGLLIEMHMLKDYKSRVEGNYQMLEAIIQQVDKEHASLRSAVRLADEQTINNLERPFTLSFQSDTAPNHTVKYSGYKQKNEKSEV
jgi:murein tripeptide amidase MpaA